MIPTITCSVANTITLKFWATFTKISSFIKAAITLHSSKLLLFRVVAPAPYTLMCAFEAIS